MTPQRDHITQRVADLAAERDAAHARRVILGLLDHAEHALLGDLADPAPVTSGGQVVRDSDGEPIPDPRTHHATLQALADVRAELAAWAALGHAHS